MRRIGLVLCIALFLATDAVVLLGVMRNRAGEPDAVIELTEREVELPYFTKENSGISLSLRWNVQGAWRRYYSPPDWFDQSKLEELGFDCSLPLEAANAEIWYGKALPRETYAALEYEGDSWKEWLALRRAELEQLAAEVERQESTPGDLEKEQERFEHSLLAMSRLFLVDVGNDPSMLRERYSDSSRFIITPAVVGLRFAQGDLPSVGGRVSEVLVDEIHVPRGQRQVLDAIRADEAESESPPWVRGDHPPRYKVRLHYGQRYEPWVVDVKPIAQNKE